MINNQSSLDSVQNSRGNDKSKGSKRSRRKASAVVKPQLSLSDTIKLWNVEGIEGSNAVKLNLKQPEHQDYFESAGELKTARRKVIQKMIKENIETIKKSTKLWDFQKIKS